MALLSGCGGGGEEDSETSLDPGAAITATLDEGPVTAELSTTSPVGRYTLTGDLDVNEGVYRFCGPISEKPEESFEDDSPTVFLGDGAGHYRTLMKFGRMDLGFGASEGEPCDRSGWLDDHPPSLPLFEYGPDGGPGYPTGGEYGAESYMQLALLALTEFEKGSGPVEATGENEFTVPFNFQAADKPPKGRSEDRWQMEPLMRRTGQTDLRLTTEEATLTSLSFQGPSQVKGRWAGPVDVSLVLGAPGSGAPVEPAEVSAME